MPVVCYLSPLTSYAAFYVVKLIALEAE